MVVAALALAVSGLPVFGLVPRGKVPRKGSHGHLDATLDATAITAHWRWHPHDNIGVRPPAGMFVLDVDPRHCGDTELAHLVADHGPLPATWTARTGSGGQHYWFNNGDTAVKSTLCTGVDIKTHTGFVVAPPSIHRSGASYEWLTPPTVSRPAAAPPWLLLLAARPPAAPTPDPAPADGAAAHSASKRYSLACLVARIAAARESQRHNTVRGAFLDAARQGDLDLLMDALVTAALAVQRTPTEINAIIRYARERGAR